MDGGAGLVDLDVLRGEVYVFNAYGRRLESLSLPDPIASHFAHYANQRTYYERLIWVSYTALGIFVLGGLLLGWRFARK